MARPHVLIITTHDSGRHWRCYGVPTVRTPAVDHLASEGVRFDRMFAVCPICSPSRGALLTGLVPLANGLVGLAGGSWNWEFRDYRHHLSHRLRQLGYHTALFGVQHETRFVERLGFCERAGEGVKTSDGGEVTACGVAERVVAFLRERRNRREPLYVQVGFFETHTPYRFGGTEPDDALGVWTPPWAANRRPPSWAKLLGRFADDPSAARAHLAELQGALRQADRAVGMILEALRETGLEEDTLVLFNTDHGPELPGAKWTLYDPGLAVAFILRWPAGGVAGGRVCPWLLSNVDFVPTLFALLGERPPEDAQGRDFSRACRQAVTDELSPRSAVFAHWVDGLNFAVRTQRYKLIRNLGTEGSAERPSLHELYDLTRDPLETQNVAGDPAYAGEMGDLVRRLDRWLADLGDPTCEGPLPAGPHRERVADYRRRYEASHPPADDLPR